MFLLDNKSHEKTESNYYLYIAEAFIPLCHRPSLLSNKVYSHAFGYMMLTMDVL